MVVDTDDIILDIVVVVIIIITTIYVQREKAHRHTGMD